MRVPVVWPGFGRGAGGEVGDDGGAEFELLDDTAGGF